MLRLSKLTDYGIIVMVCLGRHANDVLSVREIAPLVMLNMPTVSKVLKMLMVGGLVRSVRGAAGGYKLGRSPAAISLSDIIHVLEGMPSITECVSGAVSCAQYDECKLQDNWRIINQVLLNTFNQINLAQMMFPMKDKQMKMNGIPIEVELVNAAA